MPLHTRASTACGTISAFVANVRVSPAAGDVIFRSSVPSPLSRSRTVLTAPTTLQRPLGQSGYGGVVIRDDHAAPPGKPTVSGLPSVAASRIAVTGRHHMYRSLPFQTVIAPSAMAVSA